MFCMPFADVSAGAEVQRDPSAAASGSKVAASQCGCMAASSTAAPAQTAAVEPPSIEEVLATHAEPGAGSGTRRKSSCCSVTGER